MLAIKTTEDIFNMKSLFVGGLMAMALCLFAPAPARAAAGMTWISAPAFPGQCINQFGTKSECYYAVVVGNGPDDNGAYEVWINNVAQTQESFADHLAIQTKAACDKTGDNSCFAAEPGNKWVELKFVPD